MSADILEMSADILNTTARVFMTALALQSQQLMYLYFSWHLQQIIGYVLEFSLHAKKWKERVSCFSMHVSYNSFSFRTKLYN